MNYLLFFASFSDTPLWNKWSILSSLVMLLLLVGYCWVVIKNRRTSVIIRNVLIAVAAFGGFVVYFIGYNDEGTAHSLIALTLRSFLSTFEMFFFHSDLIEVSREMHHDPVYMTFFSIFHFLPFLIGFMIIIQLFGRHILTRWRLKFVSGGKNYLFFGLNEPAVCLAVSLASKKVAGSRIICLDKKIKKQEEAAVQTKLLQSVFRDRGSLFERISNLDVWLLKQDYTADTTLRQLGLAKLLEKGEAHLFFFSEDVAYNFQSALKAIDELKTQCPLSGHVTLYVRTNTDYVVNLFEGKATEHIEIQLVNPPKLAVTELVTAYPPVDYVDPDTQKAVARKDFTVLIVGFGKVGSYALRMLTEHGQFVNSVFHATVIDREMAVKQGEFELRFPGMSHYDIHYQACEVGGSEYWNLINQQMNTLDYIVVSLGDTDLNIKTAIDLHRLLERKTDRKISILVKVHCSADYGYMQVLAGAYHRIRIFGGDETIFTEEIIVDEMRVLRAKKIHDYYDKRQPEENQIAWKDLSHRKIITNISASLHSWTKLKLAGITLDELKKYACEAEFENALGEERVGNLAKGEHLHWNATLFANEWDTWPLSACTGKTQVDEKRKLHACLVDWETLETVEKHFGKPFRTYDRKNVTGLYLLAKEGLLG